MESTAPDRSSVDQPTFGRFSLIQKYGQRTSTRLGYRVVLSVSHLFRSLQRVSRVLGFSRMGLVADNRSTRATAVSDWQSRSGLYSLRRHSSSSEFTFLGSRIFSDRHNSCLARTVHG